MFGMKFHKIIFIYIIVQLLGVPYVRAQAETAAPSASSDEVAKVKADLEAQYETWADERRKNYVPKWDDHLGDLGIKANALVVENERLSHDEQSLKDEWKALSEEIEKQRSINQGFQAQIDGKKNLMEDKNWKQNAGGQLKQWERKLDNGNKELEDYNRQISSLDKKIKLGKLKLASLGVDYGPIGEQLKAEEDAINLRSELDQAADREKVLKYKRDQYKAAETAIDPKVAALKNEIDVLNIQIRDARDGGKKPAVKEDPRQQIEALKSKKEELLKDIENLKVSLEKIEHAQDMGIANQRVKALVDEMSTIEMENSQIQDEMGILKENITILKNHVKKLEYQAESINALKGKMGQMENLKNPF